MKYKFYMILLLIIIGLIWIIIIQRKEYQNDKKPSISKSQKTSLKEVQRFGIIQSPKDKKNLKVKTQLVDNVHFEIDNNFYEYISKQIDLLLYDYPKTNEKTYTVTYLSQNIKVKFELQIQDLYVYSYYLNNKTYLIKRINIETNVNAEIALFKEDLPNHKNIIMLYKILLHQFDQNVYYVFSEHLPLSLKLKENSLQRDFLNILDIALSVAYAIQYLNDMYNVSHLEICLNTIRYIVIDGKIRYKLCFSKLMRRLNANQNVRGDAGPYYFIAPETWFDNVLTQKSDIWQLGMLILFLLHGKFTLCINDFEKKRANKIIFGELLKKEYSELSLQDFFDKVLILQPEERLSIDEVILLLKDCYSRELILSEKVNTV